MFLVNCWTYPAGARKRAGAALSCTMAHTGAGRFGWNSCWGANVARRGVVLRLIGVVAVVGVLCAVCLGTAAAATTTAVPTTSAATRSSELPNTGVDNTLPIVALGLLATLCGAGVVICSRRATR